MKTMNLNVLPLIEAQITINRIASSLQHLGCDLSDDLSPNNHLDTIIQQLGIDPSDDNFDSATSTIAAYSSADTPAKIAAYRILDKLTTTLS